MEFSLSGHVEMRILMFPVGLTGIKVILSDLLIFSLNKNILGIVLGTLVLIITLYVLAKVYQQSHSFIV